tara:strand:- start:1278 stop:1589 length:312 start_codon:yes stop_codon:yes gene_type:complete
MVNIITSNFLFAHPLPPAFSSIDPSKIKPEAIRDLQTEISQVHEVSIKKHLEIRRQQNDLSLENYKENILKNEQIKAQLFISYDRYGKELQTQEYDSVIDLII